ncbi:MAG: AAA family ATPase [Clostridia bacterium]|nr:AAA family ATPase [Clostridia bacterium]
MDQNKKITAPSTSVGADAEQSSVIKTNTIISENVENCNSEYEDFLENQRELLLRSDPNYLNTISMDKLYDTVYQSKPPIIDGLLYPGTYLFAGAPKVGKSFLMAQLAYHVSTGTELWGYPVRKGTVLYLALEDDYKRLQERFYRMFGTDSTDNLHISVSANYLSDGLCDQLTGFLNRHPDTNLIIIDTLQKIRGTVNDNYSYSNDYDLITRLKQFTDNSEICLMLVHHTRKQQADDKFDMISGTNGLLGSADGAFVLQKERRTSNAAVLEIAGRDQQDQKLHIVRDNEKLIWTLDSAETELWKEPPEPLLIKLADFVTEENPQWIGSPTELVQVLGLDIKPNVLTLKLNVNAGRLYNEYGIRYENNRTHSGRLVRLTLEQIPA